MTVTNVIAPELNPRRLTIMGDRQSGKTHHLLDIAVDNAERGKAVLFDCATVPLMANTYDRCVREHARFGWPGSTVVKCLDGLREIYFESGGKIVFNAGTAYVKRYTGLVDVHLIDDTDVDARAGAELVIRAVKR
ncbi:hypothetical protein SEA_DIMINIMUS_121 [Mycobacterium phage Diminimus]|uniref:AAA-ATPase n=4 Tax=Bongovirus bongo TaxID=1983750 RepID=A0A0M4RC06_9CAUD|nr:hypothetical protein FDH95_gp124 [Mycobacterium phage Bongo]ALF00628.1 hypothetical protein SEA_BRICOLE_122 [Mycobacterium phage Bricole]AXQ52740.1 hypothetical protein SEA_IPHANE7_118 [Mycobacterium phage IPhane7]QGJ93243.1 hypothetical protein SEA_TYDAWG_115 [Mycobacterium phage TyDawg]WNM75312.1 ASCE ATPase [Mycobacterium phage Auspice]WNN96252.1 hypothetical protein SEA_DULCITA_121 [Mycobacterium phage Dulcita]WNO28196.1 hypothetical protein SEA_DIMINIMUS_121 [Mycobacterium phage Dimin